MNCVIPAANLKILVRAINALSKIGDELYFVGSKENLSIRTVNMMKTAFATVVFQNIFFSTYDVSELETNSDGQDKISCKVAMKAALSVFRTHAYKKDQKLEYCKVDLQHDATKILFTFHYRANVTIVRSLHLVEMESLQITYRFDQSPISLCAPAQLFAQVLSNFQPSDTDTTVEVTPTKAVVKNFDSGDVNVAKGVRTQMCLLRSEFNSYKVAQDTTVTFGLKPLRAAIHFAEACSLNITLNIEANKPAVLETKCPTFESSFVMATLRDGETETSFSTQNVAKNRTDRRLSKSNFNITREDQEALENVDWDDDSGLEVPGKTKQINANHKPINGKVSRNSLAIQGSSRETFDDIMKRAKRKTVDDGSDVVPNSPENSQGRLRKAIFQRCHENTYHRNGAEFGNILAANSDPESDNDMDIG